MAKHCETFDHTADVGLRAEADSLAELLEALAEGLADVLCDRSRVAPARSRTVAVRAEDVEALAVDLLSEVLLAFEMDRFLVGRVTVTSATATAAEAELAGEPHDPARHELRTEVKAVTYHQLQIAPRGRGWIGRVILDL